MNLISRLFGKCKFADKCGIYDSDSSPCTKTRGKYYGGLRLKILGIPINMGVRPAGCYREQQEQKSNQLTVF